MPSFVEGGALWFTDLSMPDPIYGLPVLTAGMFWAMVELGASDGMEGQDPKMVNNMKMFMRFFTPLMVVMGSTIPAVREPCLHPAASCWPWVRLWPARQPLAALGLA